MKLLRNLIQRFRNDKNAAVAIIMSLSMIPVMGISGAAIDYARAIRSGERLQAALDAATLSAAIIALTKREERAKAVFNASINETSAGGTITATFSTTSTPTIGSIYYGEGTVTIPTSFMKIMGIHTMAIRRVSEAQFGTGDNSCILTLGGELDLEDTTMTYNGSPNVNLAGCTIRSNKSMKCNGNGTGAVASIAAGNVINCPNAVPNAGIIPDIYASLAGNIEKKCGALNGTVDWDEDGLPSGPNVIPVARDGYTEMHVCGTLSLSGIGSMGGTGSSHDTVIVVENGNIDVKASANLNALRTTFVVSGEATNGKIVFPTGQGQSAKLAISSSTSNGNPWAGLAIYQDPRSSDIVESKWGPGATLSIDGINYQPRTDLTLSGIAETGSSQCSKLVTYSFRIDGAVSLKQDATGCKSQQVAQFHTHPRLIR